MVSRGVETKKTIQTSLCHFFSNTSFMYTEYDSLNSSFEAFINFYHLANQTGGILHSPPPPPYPYTRWILIEYTCYDHFP